MASVADDATYFYQVALNAGANISSISNPALNGTYSIDDSSQFTIVAMFVSVAINGTFTDGSTEKAWLDQTGQFHVFGLDEFQTFATAIASYVDALKTTRTLMSMGQEVVWPDNNLSIA